VPRLLSPILPAGTFSRRPQPVLDVGDGLALRPWEAGDAPSLAAAYEDPAIQRWHHRSMDEGEAREWIAGAAARWAAETDAEWAVTNGDDPIGRVALRGVSLEVGQAEVAYWTAPHARGAGVARRAAARLATWALDEVGFWRLLVEHSTRNPASCRAALAAGFGHEADLTLAHLHDDGWHDVHLHTRFHPAAGS
jgi:RimJ/RimL family protein N-acetyltransferase